MSTRVLSLGQVREKLRNLQEYFPGQEEETYKFGSYLAERLDPGLVPEGFGLAAHLALDGLERGIDEDHGQPIANELVGLPSEIYQRLFKQIPEIAEAVCSEEFAKRVRYFFDCI